MARRRTVYFAFRLAYSSKRLLVVCDWRFPTVNWKAENPILMLLALLFTTLSSAQIQPIQATIDASKTGAPISKYIYGQFLEHIGGIVNNNIWAEMLDDRKFYFPINSHPPAEPSGPTWRRTALRHWMPIGADEFVTMDTDRPYVGEHTPMVNLSSSEAHGIQQAGLAVRKGKSYAGRVVLAGTPGTTVQVSLIWGNAATDRQTVVINKVGPEYRKFPLTFRVQGDSDDARFEIVGSGTGAFLVNAGRQRPRLSRGSHRRAEATAFRRVSLAWGQLCFRTRVARCDRRSRQASADHGSGLARGSAERRRDR